MPDSKFPTIVKKYREAQGMTVRQFGAAIGKSFQSVNAWELGKDLPRYEVFYPLYIERDGWVREFAGDCLAALRPESFQPFGQIGRQVLATTNANTGA
jgi:transcriptional regulator with XRE-family HTH domain